MLSLKPDTTYALTGQTATYAQRVYVNGELLNETGKVSDNARDFRPKTDLYTVYFTPKTSTTEMIVQHAWFNHRVGGLKFDTTARLCCCNGTPLSLTQKEFSLLLQLARSNGQGVAKEVLYENVWGNPLHGDSSALYTAISRVNSKLKKENSKITISYDQGKGYMLEFV